MISVTTFITAILYCHAILDGSNYTLVIVSYIVDVLGNVPLTQVMNMDEENILWLLHVLNNFLLYINEYEAALQVVGPTSEIYPQVSDTHAIVVHISLALNGLLDVWHAQA